MNVCPIACDCSKMGPEVADLPVFVANPAA